MNKRVGPVIGILLLSIVLWRIWSGWDRRTTPPDVAIIATPEKLSTSSTPSQTGVTEEDLKRTPLKGSNEKRRALIAEVREIMQQANQPIAFYGLVMDQNNQPISGVKVVLAVRHTEEVLPGFTDDRFRYFDEVTDSRGRFTLTNTKGAVLSVKSLEKGGYEMSPHAVNQSFWYWRDVPSHGYRGQTERPEIFRMWKKSGAEKLIVGEKFYGIVPDGRSYAIDLLEDKKVESSNVGDFKISIRRPAQLDPGSKYNWSCTVEGIGGGVIEAQEEFMNRAPESGYQSLYEVAISANDPKWSDRATRRLYLKSNDGKIYARLETEIFANYQNNSVFSIKFYANPNGSRNLEYDTRQGEAQRLPELPPR
jgi:hypothetical protein